MMPQPEKIKRLHPELRKVLTAMHEGRVVDYNSPGDFFSVHTAEVQRGLIRERGYEVLLRITKACNVHCRHCFIAASPRTIPLEVIKTWINNLPRENHSVLMFVLSGGEPTLHPDFFEILYYLLKRDVRRIVIQSNGIRFAEQEFFEQLPGSRAIEFFISLPAAEPEAYNTLTGSTAFPLAMQGITRITSRYSTRLNFVVNRLNYKNLAATARFVRKRFSRRHTRLLISNLGCLDAFDSGSLLVRYSDLLPVFRKTLRWRPNIAMTLSGGCSFPLCFYRELGRRINKHLLYLANPAQTGYGTLDRQFYKNELCRECRYTTYCFGFASRYVEHFGDSEIKPC